MNSQKRISRKADMVLGKGVYRGKMLVCGEPVSVVVLSREPFSDLLGMGELSLKVHTSEGKIGDSFLLFQLGFSILRLNACDNDELRVDAVDFAWDVLEVLGVNCKATCPTACLVSNFDGSKSAWDGLTLVAIGIGLVRKTTEETILCMCFHITMRCLFTV